MILAIDPGPFQSAICWLGSAGEPLLALKIANDDAIRQIGLYGWQNVVCERIRSYGMPAGAELFETCEWVGRFWQASITAGQRWHWLPRKQVVMALCGSAKAKDSNVRQALIDRYGGQEKAIGRKPKNKREEVAGICHGPLHEYRDDMWAALAVACVWQDQWRAGLIEPRTRRGEE